MKTITAAEYRAEYQKVQSKYHSHKTEVDGIIFDSQREATRYCELKMLKDTGKICRFGRQPSFLFASGIRYRPDFIVFGANGEIWVEDVKGFETKDFVMKQKMWANEYPGLPLVVIR